MSDPADETPALPPPDEAPLDDYANKRDLPDEGWFTAGASGEAGATSPAEPDAADGGQDVAALHQHIAQMSKQIKWLLEQIPRRVPAGEDNKLIPVTLLENGTGVQGTTTTTATWQYTATSTIAGAVTTYGTTMTPVWPRPKGTFAKATKGIVCKRADGTVTLEIAYEVRGTGTC